MSWQVIFRDEARSDFDEAYDWYETKKDGLGDEFAAEVQQVVHRLETNPKIHAKVYKEARRAVVKRFPYCVYYVVHDELVEIAAVIHGKRHPRRWQKRI